MSEEPREYEVDRPSEDHASIELEIYAGLQDRITKAAEQQSKSTGLDVSVQAWILAAVIRQLENQEAGIAPYDKITLEEVHALLPAPFHSLGEGFAGNPTEYLITGGEIFRVLQMLNRAKG